jgi:DNA-binding winged helix-turn-helix (wHTH) protein/TolB-like protein
VTQTSGRVYRFGPFRYDAEQRLLFRGDDLVQLAPKTLETLHVLLERRDRVVSRSELLSAVWPDTTVEEIGLARNISLLRKALGDEGESGWIETIPKRGYRFVGEVTVDGSPLSKRPRRRMSRGWAIAAGLVLLLVVVYWQFYLPSRYLPSGAVSLAIVPFEVLGSGSEIGAWSRGLDEVTAAEVAKVGGIHVVSPATIRRYQTLRISPAVMSRLLGVQVILEGTVQRFGDRVRVTARLADVHSGKLIWADSIDLAAADAAAQKEAASRIAAQVRARLRL